MTKEEEFESRMQKVLEVAAQYSPRTVWKIRIVLICLLFVWIVGALFFHYQVKQDEKRIEQSRIEASRRQEFQRRGAQYRQDLQNFNQGVRSRNVFDGR